MDRVCILCGKTGLFRCSRCKTQDYCSKHCQSQHWQSIHKKECSACVPLVKLGPSLRHGQGLFAKQDIAAGTRTCFYDGTFVTGRRLALEEHVMSLDRDGGHLIGYTEVKHPLGIAQFANSPDVFTLQHTMDPLDMAEEMLRYDCKTVGTRNALFTEKMPDNKIWLMTTKDLKKDDEVLVHYGAGYWVSISQHPKLDKTHKRAVDIYSSYLANAMVDLKKNLYGLVQKGNIRDLIEEAIFMRAHHNAQDANYRKEMARLVSEKEKETFTL